MAFMILAIFFFFALVGLFFIGWQFSNLKSDFSLLEKEKALSALKVIADSTELNCEQSEDWCIDRDKLIAFSENSYLYEGFWSAASIEVLMVYPVGNSRKAVFTNSSSLDSSNVDSSKVQYSSGRSAGGAPTDYFESESGDKSESESFVTYGGEPIKCPNKDCDLYVLYDNGQKNKQSFSAYVTVCETIERSHEICELAKLILGVKIKDE